MVSSTIFNQTLIMLILIAIGVICAKTKLISEASNKDLSKFVLQVVNPVVIFMSYQKPYRTELARNLLITFGISVAAMTLVILLSYLFVRKKQGREFEIERFSSVYSNCGFMGIPLVDAIYHDEGVFYLTAFITVFNLIVWTHGVILISGKKDFRQVVKVFYSPTIISIVLGEGGSGGALALGVCDELAMLENAEYSVLSPRGFASILWKDASREEEASDIMRITAEDMVQLGVAEAIIEEPLGGAHNDLDKISENIKEYLSQKIPEKCKKDIDVLLKERYTKFRKIGAFTE